MAPQNGTEPVDRLHAPAESRHAWERLIWVCHTGFGVTLVLAVALSLTKSGHTGSDYAMLTALPLVLVGWFSIGTAAGMFSGPRLFPRLSYFALGWAILGWSIALDPVYLLVYFALLWHVATSLPVRWALPGIVVFLGVLTWEASWQRSSEALVLEFIVPTLSGLCVILFVKAIMDQSSERLRLINELEETRAELAASERQARVLQERQRMAREIHDTLAQGFTSIVMHLEAADESVPKEIVRLQRHLNQARQTARDSLAEARRLVWALVPESLERATLPEALTRVGENWGRESGVDAQVLVTGAQRQLHPAVQVTLLRATQEALGNVRKHAKAKHVAVTLSYMDGSVTLDVQDDGVGFEPAKAKRARSTEHGGGFGLEAMRQRALELGGSLLVEAAPGHGTTLVVEIPTGPEAADGDGTSMESHLEEAVDGNHPTDHSR